jgi:O-antigen ligase
VTLTAASLVLAVAALAALVAVFPALRRANAHGDLDSSTILTFGVAALMTMPAVLVTADGNFTRRFDAFRELVPVYPSWHPAAVRLGVLLAGLLALALLARRLLLGGTRLHPAGLVAIVLWSLAHLAAGLHGRAEVTPRGLVLLACLAAATVLPRGRGAALGAGLYGVALAIASGLAALFRHDVAFVPCRDECTPIGEALQGVLTNENLLGISLVAAMPFAFLGFRGAARYGFSAYLAAMAIATTSRTATGAALIVLTALVLIGPRLDGARQGVGRTAFAAALLVGAAAGSLVVAEHRWSDAPLNNRPTLWRVAADYIERSPWFGYGPDRWATLYEWSEIPRSAQRTTHNQWMDILFVSGVVGALLLVTLIAVIAWTAGAARPGVLIAAASIFLVGTTEGAWAIGYVDLLTFSLLALLLTGPAAPVVDTALEPQRARTHPPPQLVPRPAGDPVP